MIRITPKYHKFAINQLDVAMLMLYNHFTIKINHLFHNWKSPLASTSRYSNGPDWVKSAGLHPITPLSADRQARLKLHMCNLVRRYAGGDFEIKLKMEEV